MAFTAHNIRLDDGSLTRPETGYEMTEHPLWRAVQRFLGALYPDGCVGVSVVDLGCLEGGYTVEFARMGLKATGIEVRQSNFDNCIRVKASVDLPNLQFIHDDAWNVDRYGPFDIVFCCGLLYHLAEPRHYMELLSKVCRKVLILDTHHATEDDREHFGLSALAEHEGLSGRWYTEYVDETNTHDDGLHWASWGNARSFWPLKHELTKAMTDAGFTSALELIDSRSWELVKQRTTLIGLKATREP